MSITTFNTGRGYGPNGQIIHISVNNGVVKFYDETRDICGAITTLHSPERDDDLETFVLTQYDNGNYEYDSEVRFTVSRQA